SQARRMRCSSSSSVTGCSATRWTPAWAPDSPTVSRWVVGVRRSQPTNLIPYLRAGTASTVATCSHFHRPLGDWPPARDRMGTPTGAPAIAPHWGGRLRRHCRVGSGTPMDFAGLRLKHLERRNRDRADVRGGFSGVLASGQPTPSRSYCLLVPGQREQ